MNQSKPKLYEVPPPEAPTINRPLPSSEQSERIILGTILLDNELMLKATAHLTPAMFYHPTHRRVFEAMQALQFSGRAIDPILISEELKKDGAIEAIGGITTISNLSHGVPHYTNIDEYLTIVVDKSRLRDVIRTCNDITRNALAEEDTAEKVLESAAAAMFTATAEKGSRDRFRHVSDVMDRDVLPALYALHEGHSRKIPTGFPAIDRIIGGGVGLGDVVILLSNTGQGKSALALKMARLIAQQGNGVAFASGEMPNTENGLRMLSQAANHYNLNSVPYIKTYELEHLEKWTEALRTLPIYFDSKTTDVKTLGTYLRALVRTKGVKILVVDYIQLFKVEPNDRRSRYERISEVSQELKRLAVELEIGIIEVAQVNRVGAKGSELSIHDLDGSGQLEKDASNILIIEIQEDKKVKLRNDKGRNVGKSEVWGTWKGQTLNFEFEEGEVSVI